MSIRYSIEPELGVGEFLEVLRESGLGERRPVNNATRIEGMLRNADLIVAARNEEGVLVGVSRAITDYFYCTYLSDLAVVKAFQKQGIGKELIRRTHEAAGVRTKLVLLAAPAAEGYYPHIGMERHGSCWVQKAKE